MTMAGVDAGYVFCDSTLTLPLTGSYEMTAPLYNCNPVSCEASYYVWDISGPVSAVSIGNPLPFNFSLEGTYTVTINTSCGSNKCPPCKFTIIIRTGCECKGWLENKPGFIQDANGHIAAWINCNTDISLSHTGLYQFTAPGFVCNPDSCMPHLIWQVSGPLNGVGSGNPFAFNFALPGSTTVVITPYCGTHECPPASS